MKKIIWVLFIIISTSAFGQQPQIDKNFVSDFTKALDKNFSAEQLNKMFRDYSGILTPGSDVTQLSEALQGHELAIYPLHDFKSQKLYTDNIINLLNSKNSNQRILAYLVIASSGDTSKEGILLEKIKTETGKGNLLWSGMALLYLNTSHTSPLFDFLVKNEDFGDAHMLPLYIKLNNDSLQQTAYNRISSANVKAKVLAAQILSVTPLTAKTETLLKQAIKEWDIIIKGYAIYTVGQLQIGNLLETLEPLLNNPKTRRISLEALANSPTPKDRGYLLQLINKQDTVSDDLLDCLFKSKNADNLEVWLKLLYTKPIPPKYYFAVFKQPLLQTAAVLPILQDALMRIKDPNVLGELVRALEGKTDDKSIDIMIALLKNENKTVRYWTAKTLEDNSSTRLKNSETKRLLTSGLQDGN